MKVRTFISTLFLFLCPQLGYAGAEGPSLNFTQEAYAKPFGNLGQREFFGAAVAISDDTIIVGAPFGDTGGIRETGVAYVLVRDGDTWLPQTELRASDGEHGDLFGSSVSISGDTIVVGAPGDDGPDDDAELSGAAFVFVREAGIWNQQAYLRASNAGDADRFGVSVSVSGDTIVVGANGEDSRIIGAVGDPNANLLSDSGAAYVFERVGATWPQLATLKATEPGRGDKFGRSVAISGDTIVIGAPFETNSGTGVNPDPNAGTTLGAGAAYVFVGDSGTWNQQAYLKASNTGDFDNFGETVAISGDTIAIGAPREDSGAIGVNGDGASDAVFRSGAAYVYGRSGGTWEQDAYLKASNTGSGDEFGSAVGVSGNAIVVGARFESSNARGNNGDSANDLEIYAGAAFLFGQDEGTGVWSQRTYVKASNSETSDVFGSSLAISAGTMVIGAPGEAGLSSGVNGDQDTNAVITSIGAAYIFRPADETIAPIASVGLEVGAGGSPVARFVIPQTFGRIIGMEFSPDLSPGSWIELGNFALQDSETMSFVETDVGRLNRKSGYYRAFLRPQVP